MASVEERTLANDELYLRLAIAAAARAREAGNHPFGAVLVDEHGEVLLEAENTVLTSRDFMGHAEMNLIREALRQFGAEPLASSTVYVSAEPCAMCAGAFYWARVRRVVFGLSGDAVREMTSIRPTNPYLQVGCRDVLSRGRPQIDVSGPNLQDEARTVHLGYWT
jgi:tRNA(Arg) A34 adenosine deaminase TadA